MLEINDMVICKHYDHVTARHAKHKRYKQVFKSNIVMAKKKPIGTDIKTDMTFDVRFDAMNTKCVENCS